MTPPVALIGMMGCGKTTLGKRLAENLKTPFIDLDHWIETRQQTTIPDLFQQIGESGFRRLERQALTEIIQTKKPGVLATGGGFITTAENRALLRKHYLVLYLRAGLKTLTARLRGQAAHRPLLKSATGLNRRLTALLRQREQHYRQTGDHIIRQTDTDTAEQTMEKILNTLRHPSRIPPAGDRFG